MITKALIIDEPWLSKILAGDKIWEMRSTQCAHRGLFGLIRKGSGQVIGVASLSGVSGPFDNKSLAQSFERHHVGADLYEKPTYKWRYAWQLNDVVQLDKPVRYQHKNGAVTWVELNSEAVAGIEQQIHQEPSVSGEVTSAVEAEMTRLFASTSVLSVSSSSKLQVHRTMAKPFLAIPAESFPQNYAKANSEFNVEGSGKNEIPSVDSESVNITSTTARGVERIAKGIYRLTSTVSSTPIPEQGLTDKEGVKEVKPGVYELIKPRIAEDNVHVSTLTQGNINNSHFYISRQTKLFPEDAWGGTNRKEAGSPVTFKFDGLDQTVVSDIDSSKRILRSRAPVRQFFSLHKLRAGDRVQISRVAAREFKVTKINNAVK